MFISLIFIFYAEKLTEVFSVATIPTDSLWGCIFWLPRDALFFSLTDSWPMFNKCHVLCLRFLYSIRCRFAWVFSTQKDCNYFVTTYLPMIVWVSPLVSLFKIACQLQWLGSANGEGYAKALYRRGLTCPFKFLTRIKLFIQLSWWKRVPGNVITIGKKIMWNSTEVGKGIEMITAYLKAFLILIGCTS